MRTRREPFSVHWWIWISAIIIGEVLGLWLAGVMRGV